MLWKLGLPNGVAWLTWTLATFADAFILGILGTIPLAVIALVFPFQMLMLMMAAGAIGGGTTSSVGRAIGNKDIEKAQSSCFHSIVISFLMSCIYAVIFYFFSHDIFLFMGASGEVLNGAIAYSKIFFSFSVFFWLFNILASIIRGIGDTYTPAKAITLGSVLQIILSFLFTLGIGAFPEMGVIGPSISIVICHIVMTLYLIYYLFFVQKTINIRFQKLKLNIFNDIMKVGGLGLLNSITIAMTVAVVTGYVGNFGDKALAGYGLGSRLELILTPIIFGLGAALTASVSINIGSKQFKRARQIAWTGGLISFGLIGIIGLFAAIFPQLWINNFSSDPEALIYGKTYLNIVAPFYCLFGLGQALYFASQGTGKLINPIFIGLLRFFTVVIFGYIAISYNVSIDYIFYGVSLGLIITGIGMSLCLLGSEWKKG